MKHQLKKKPLSPEVRWQRGLLAFFTMVFLGLGAALHTMPSSDSSSSKFAAGTLLKVGVVLGLAWISAPQLERLGWQRLRGTLLVAVIVVILLYAIRPRIGAIAAAILIVGSAGFSLLGWFRRLTQPPP